MSGDYQLVSQYEIARVVAKKFEKEDKNKVKVVYAKSATIVKMFSCISKFTNYYFKKAMGSAGTSEYNTVICDVPVIGYFTFEKGIDIDKYDFIPTPFFVEQSMIQTEKKNLQVTHYNKPVLKKDLGVDKIAMLCGIQQDVAKAILIEIVK